MYEREHSNLGEFGWIIATITGVAEGAALGAAAAIKHDSTRKELRRAKTSQQHLLSTLEAAKQQELAAKEGLFAPKSQTELLRDVSTKKLVIIGGAAAVLVALTGMAVLYLSVGGK